MKRLFTLSFSSRLHVSVSIKIQIDGAFFHYDKERKDYMTNSVLFSTNENGVAELTLNQPKAINSLTYDMLVPVKEKLIEWEKDDAINVVIIQGAGEKGFCAGGDMKALYEAGKNDNAKVAGAQFFTLEYEIDQMIDTFSKPIIACLDGIVMGGGVGLAYGASDRIVTEKTKWAMPEMNIGFFPDVGAAYFLNKAPGQIGRYLALTSSVINGGEVMSIHAADHFMQSKDLERFIEAVKATSWAHESVKASLQELIKRYTSEATGNNQLQTMQAEIDEHFRFDTVEEIVASLKKGTSTFASETAQTLLAKSPVSLKVTLKQLSEGKGKSFAECLETDLVLANNFMGNPDFFEGVRSVLIDKDHTPNYQYKVLSDVSEALVNSFFES